MIESDLMYLLEAAESKPGSKKVAVVIGRFNPPTMGHYTVINAVKKFIKSNPKLGLEVTPVVVVIGGSKSDLDLARNPLSVDERILFMTSSGQANGVIFMSAKNAFEAFANIRAKDMEPIAIAAGSDRLPDYLKILDKHFTDEGSPIKHHGIRLERDADAVETKKEDKDTALNRALKELKNKGNIDVDMVSGSLARRAVELDYKEEFAKIVGLESKPVLAQKMFNKIKAALGSSDV